MGLLKEVITPRANLPPLLCCLDNRPPEQLDYMGVAYGLTPPLYKYTSHSLTQSVIVYCDLHQVLEES